MCLQIMDFDLEQIEIPTLSELAEPGVAEPVPALRSSDVDRAGAADDDGAKPTAEYALHILFTRFVRFTERKLAQLPAQDVHIERLLGYGADAEFDLILESLGHVATRRPKVVIDSLMYWRKTKRDVPGASLASLYILCRALMEIIKQTPHDVLGERLSGKLEDIIFSQLVSTDVSVVNSDGVRGANWRYLARLLGEMSSFRLASISERFSAELERRLVKSKDENAGLLLESMQYLQIQMYPEENLEESAFFLESLAKFYAQIPASTPLKAQFATALSRMLEPLAESITVEVNQPVWAASIERLFKTSLERPNSTLFAQAQPPPLLSANFHLSVMSLCLSPRIVFAEHWLELLESCLQKNKTKVLKNIRVYPSAAKLFWVYIFRYSESLNLTTKKIEIVKRLLLTNANRKYWQALAADREACEACISILRAAFQGYQQYTLDELLFPLLVGTDGASVAQQQAIPFDSAVIPERASIAVAAFSGVIEDLRAGARPPFPGLRTRVEQPKEVLVGAKEARELPHRPTVPAALQASIDLFGTCIGQICAWLDQGGGTEPQSRQNSVTQLVALAAPPPPPSHLVRLGLKTPEQYLLLLSVRSWPAWFSIDKHLRYLDVLCRCVANPLSVIAQASVISLTKLSETCDLKTLLNPFSKALMAADARKAAGADLPPLLAFQEDTFQFEGLNLTWNSLTRDADLHAGLHQKPDPGAAGALLRYLSLYVNLIETWIRRLRSGDGAVQAQAIEAQMITLWAAVEEIEGNGLFFLCSHDIQIRSLGLRILWLTNTMDEAILNYKNDVAASVDRKPARIINLLHTTPIFQIATERVKKSELSAPLWNRLAKFRSKRASLARLAESSYGLDNALWLKLFPEIITLCFETHPIPVAICRDIVTDRLVQMHEPVFDISEKPNSVCSSLGVLGLVGQFKIYLVFSCATLTSTEEQKLHVPVPNSGTIPAKLSGFGTTHNRKRSYQRVTLHHQKIMSARSVFRIVLPLLRGQNNLVQDAIVLGLSCTNSNTYKVLLECLQPVLTDALPKLYPTYQSQTALSTKQTPHFRDVAFRTVLGVTQIMRLTTHFLNVKEIRQDVWIRTETVNTLQALRDALASIQTFQMTPLRIAFCELLAQTCAALGPSLMLTGRNLASEWLLMWSTVEMWSQFGSNAHNVMESRAMLRRKAGSDVIATQVEVLNYDLDRATASALAALLADSQQFVSDLQPALRWVYALLCSNIGVGKSTETQEIGRIALENLLVSHASSLELLHEVVSRCYHNSSDKSRVVAKIYFVALVNTIEHHPELIRSKVENPQQFLALALFKIGDPDCETRFKAVKLIELVEMGLYGSSVIAGEYQFRLRSSSPSVYKREIFVLSQRLAARRSHESFYLFSQMTRAFQAVNDSDRKDILSVLLPWMQNIEFQQNDLGLQMVLVNLLEITTLFSARMQHEVEALWVALCTCSAGATTNALRILEFLLSFCMRQRTPGAVSVSRTVLIYLLSSPASTAITEKLLSYLEPAYMITQGSSEFSDLVSPACAEEFPYVASLGNIVSLANANASEKEGKSKSATLPPFSYGQLAVVFLVDTISSSSPVMSKLPSLIHVCIVLGDHFVALIKDKSRELLLNLAGMFNPDMERMERLTELLESLHWRYEDDSGAVPEPLADLISGIFAHLGNGALDYREWAQISIHWATTSNVRHIACRSLQIYRCLNLYLDNKMIGDLLARLSTTISEKPVEIQAFATQILMTINSIIDKADQKQLALYPSLFWATVASLTTANESEYIEALSALSSILSKCRSPSPTTGELDFDGRTMAAAVLAAYPPKMEGTLAEYEGLIPLVVQGLRSQNTADLSHKVMNQLIALSEVPSDEERIALFGRGDPLPTFLAASLPWFLHAMDQPHTLASLIPTAQVLQRLVTERSGSLSRILESFVKRRFWSKWDFQRQYVLALPVAFPDEIDHIVLLFLSMVSNGAIGIRKSSLEVLATLIPEAKQKNVSNRTDWHGADFIAPLLRLLTTPEVEEALNVLDIINKIQPNSMDKDILRMTLGSRQQFKEYESTKTLFGIPDAFGWSVSSPLESEQLTQANVHSVFYLCASMESPANGVDSDFDMNNVYNVQPFQNDEFIPQTDATSYSQVHTDGNSVHDTAFESMDKILTDLDEFDNFFTRVAAPRQHLDLGGQAGREDSDLFHQEILPVNSGDGRREPSPRTVYPQRFSFAGTPTRARTVSDAESIPQLYDKKVSQILNRSLARTPSQVSFRTSFADSFRTNPSRSQIVPRQNSLRSQHPSRRSSVESQGQDPLAESNGSGFASAFASRGSLSLESPINFESSNMHDPLDTGGRSIDLSEYDEGSELTIRKSSSASDVSPKHKLDAPAPLQERSSSHSGESSFRLESLLKGKRRGKEKEKRSQNKDEPSKFQFPPR